MIFTFTVALYHYKLQVTNACWGTLIKSGAVEPTTSSLVHYTFDVGAIPNTCTAKSARPSSKNTNCANCHVRATHRLLKKTSPRVIVCKESDATCAHQILVTSDSCKKLPVFVFQWVWTVWGKWWWRESVLQWREVQRIPWEEWQIPAVWCQFCM